MKNNLSQTSYIISIISLVMAFFQPLAGLVFGIIGAVQSSKGKSDLDKRAKKNSIIGIIISLIVLIISIFAVGYLNSGNVPY